MSVREFAHVITRQDNEPVAHDAVFSDDLRHVSIRKGLSKLDWYRIGRKHERAIQKRRRRELSTSGLGTLTFDRVPLFEDVLPHD